MDIQTGEHIHHPHHGIGKVESIRKRSFCGRDEATYAEVYFERDELTLTMLKNDMPDTVRSLITTAEAKEILTIIETWSGKPKKQWKARADAHLASIEGGDPFQYAKTFTELSRMAEAEELRLRDRSNLQQSRDLLTEELARALKKTPLQAEKLIQKALDA